METRLIARVNNVDIVSTSDEQLVPIRPICEALGIAYQPQHQKLQEDEDLSSVITLSMTTGADGKKYEMVCLPVEFVFGWLFTINPKNVKPEAQPAVRRYRMECYRALYEHFTGAMQRINEQNQVEISILEQKNRISQQLDELKTQQTQLKQKDAGLTKQLEQIRAERLSNEPMLFP